MDIVNLKIVLILTVGFALASLLGYLSNKARLSALLGYLLAGYIIGPYSPGIVLDVKVAEQLAEIGVILMMFGVGMHFKWEDLVSVKYVAIPGAIGQTLVTAIIATYFVVLYGWSVETGVIIGLAIGVASTVVLVRVLSDNKLLYTIQGHIAVGWLIVEDVLTVAVLILLPSLADTLLDGRVEVSKIIYSVFLAFFKFFALAAIVFTVGTRLVSYLLFKVARTRSHELFTLSVLAVTFVIAVSSALIFGTSIALGAFLAGMVIGRTELRHQASAHILPLKDAFIVIFFLSVGMLFDPKAIIDNFTLFTGILSIILIVKPLAAFFIVYFLGYSVEVGLTVALALAQIGEFSFILAEEALKYKLLPDAGYDLLVACALISIAINPLLFKWFRPFKDFLERWFYHKKNVEGKAIARAAASKNKAVIIGFGPFGQAVHEILTDNDFSSVVVDRNVDTITRLLKEGKAGIYGDASKTDIQEIAEIQNANILVVTSPDLEESLGIIETAQELNPNINILARTRYIGDKKMFDNLDIPCVCCEGEGLKVFVRKLKSIIYDFRKNVSH